MAARKARAAPLMQSLYDWIQQQMKTLSRHSDTAKAFAYLLKQWDALNVYVIEHIQDWPANRVRDLLPWKVDLSSQ
ncbi:hypothetical protein ACN58_18295 [Escherichia coli]|nr:hypothetical protein ACN58_18295 [Escherichia coli]